MTDLAVSFIEIITLIITIEAILLGIILRAHREDSIARDEFEAATRFLLSMAICFGFGALLAISVLIESSSSILLSITSILLASGTIIAGLLGVEILRGLEDNENNAGVGDNFNYHRILLVAIFITWLIAVIIDWSNIQNIYPKFLYIFPSLGVICLLYLVFPWGHVDIS